MADSVVKLRVDSQEYDAKIKRASDGVRAFGENCRKAGESVSKADQDTITYVRSLGQMDTVSKNVKGKISEMTNAFTELSVQYKQLTDEEKQSPFGQALASSLDQLKTRINESRAQLTAINSELGNTTNKGNETGGAMAALASKFTINVDALKLLNAGLTAAKVALGVAKDAFFASEATVDEWGRIVDSSRSLYEGFLTSINTGDISGFLGRIDQIVSAARAAYNELDRLGTMRTIQAPQISAQQTENDRMRMMLQTGRYIAPIDGRKATPGLQDGQVLTPQQMKTIEQQLQNGMKNVVNLVGNEVKQTSKAIDAVYVRQGQELGISVKEFRKGTSSMDEFDKRIAGYEKYKQFEAAHTTTNTTSTQYGVVSSSRRDNVANPYAEYAKWGVFRVDGQRYNDLVRLIQQRDQQAAQAYNMQGQAYRTINRAEGITTRSIMGGGSTGGGRTTTTTQAPPPAGSIAAQEAKVQALTKAWREATDEAGRNGYAGQLEEAKKVLEQMQGKNIDITPKGSLKDLSNQMRDLQAKRENLADPIQIKVVDDQIAELKRDIDALNSGDVLYFSLKVQEDELTARLDDLKAKKDLLEDPASIRIVNDDIKRVQAELDEANKKKIETKVEIDTSELETELAHLQEMRDLLSKPVEISVIVKDIEDVESQIENLRNQRNPVEQPKQPPTITLEQKVALSIAEDNIDTDIQTLTNLLRVKIENGLDDIDIPAEHLQRAILGGEGFDSINIPDDYWQTLADDINAHLEALGIDPIVLDVQTGNVTKGAKAAKEGWQEAAQAIGTVGGALQQLEDPSIKIVGIVGQAIANIALGFAQATASDSKLGVFGWIAAVAGGLATMIGTISAIHSATGYAEGGIIKGNTYSGDQIMANGGTIGLNAGELILNRAQQGVIADALDGGATPKIIIEGVVDGENLRLVQRNSNRMRGRGEYVTTKTR